jgi:hypothetical protein
MDIAQQQRTGRKRIHVPKSRTAELSDVLTALESIQPGIDRAQHTK